MRAFVGESPTRTASIARPAGGRTGRVRLGRTPTPSSARPTQDMQEEKEKKEKKNMYSYRGEQNNTYNIPSQSLTNFSLLFYLFVIILFL